MARDTWLAGARRWLSPVLAALVVAGCQTPMGGTSQPAAAPAAPVSTAEVIGTGSVRVAMLLPRTATGNAPATAQAFRNAAALAVQDFPSAGIQVAIYDTAGTPPGAQAAIGSAVGEGARIVLGPVFASSVSAVAPQARQAGLQVVAFSSDASVAGPGVYLLSFLPADDVRRIISYSAEQGRKSFAALLPANAYGTVAEAAFRQSVASVGGRVVAIERYEATSESMQAKAQAIAALAPQIDALFMPDGGSAASALASALASSGLSRDKVKLLGSGQWDDPRILADANLAGGWFPAPTKSGFDSFAQKYRTAYGSEPPRNATLAYDATVLAAGLVRQYGENPFSTSVLTNPNGFAGVDGIFRFQANGLVERRLAIYEVTGTAANMIAPAARTFTGGS